MDVTTEWKECEVQIARKRKRYYLGLTLQGEQPYLWLFLESCRVSDGALHCLHHSSAQSNCTHKLKDSSNLEEGKCGAGRVSA